MSTYTASTRGEGRRPFTDLDDFTVFDYVFSLGAFTEVGRGNFWKHMVDQKVLDRQWDSIRNRWRRHIVPKRATLERQYHRYLEAKGLKIGDLWRQSREANRRLFERREDCEVDGENRNGSVVMGEPIRQPVRPLPHRLPEQQGIPPRVPRQETSTEILSNTEGMPQSPQFDRNYLEFIDVVILDWVSFHRRLGSTRLHQTWADMSRQVVVTQMSAVRLEGRWNTHICPNLAQLLDKYEDYLTINALQVGDVCRRSSDEARELQRKMGKSNSGRTATATELPLRINSDTVATRQLFASPEPLEREAAEAPVSRKVDDRVLNWVEATMSQADAVPVPTASTAHAPLVSTGGSQPTAVLSQNRDAVRSQATVPKGTAHVVSTSTAPAPSKSSGRSQPTVAPSYNQGEAVPAPAKSTGRSRTTATLSQIQADLDCLPSLYAGRGAATFTISPKQYKRSQAPIVQPISTTRTPPKRDIYIDAQSFTPSEMNNTSWNSENEFLITTPTSATPINLRGDSPVDLRQLTPRRNVSPCRFPKAKRPQLNTSPKLTSPNRILRSQAATSQAPAEKQKSRRIVPSLESSPSFVISPTVSNGDAAIDDYASAVASSPAEKQCALIVSSSESSPSFVISSPGNNDDAAPTSPPTEENLATAHEKAQSQGLSKTLGSKAAVESPAIKTSNKPTASSRPRRKIQGRRRGKVPTDEELFAQVMIPPLTPPPPPQTQSLVELNETFLHNDTYAIEEATKEIKRLKKAPAEKKRWRIGYSTDDVESFAMDSCCDGVLSRLLALVDSQFADPAEALRMYREKEANKLYRARMNLYKEDENTSEGICEDQQSYLFEQRLELSPSPQLELQLLDAQDFLPAEQMDTQDFVSAEQLQIASQDLLASEQADTQNLPTGTTSTGGRSPQRISPKLVENDQQLLRSLSPTTVSSPVIQRKGPGLRSHTGRRGRVVAVVSPRRARSRRLTLRRGLDGHLPPPSTRGRTCLTGSSRHNVGVASTTIPSSDDVSSPEHHHLNAALLAYDVEVHLDGDVGQMRLLEAVSQVTEDPGQIVLPEAVSPVIEDVIQLSAVTSSTQDDALPQHLADGFALGRVDRSCQTNLRSMHPTRPSETKETHQFWLVTDP